jgi:hypothetical protein
VPVERLRRHPAAACLDVLGRRHAADLLAERAQLVEQLLPRREPPRDEPGLTLRGVPRAEVLDHGLRVDGRLRIGLELAHRRRLAEPLGARRQLRQDLRVGVALAHAGLELRKLLLVDVLERREDRLRSHPEGPPEPRLGVSPARGAKGGSACRQDRQIPTSVLTLCSVSIEQS